jgi:hypothetical protein
MLNTGWKIKVKAEGGANKNGDARQAVGVAVKAEGVKK